MLKRAVLGVVLIVSLCGASNPPVPSGGNSQANQQRAAPEKHSGTQDAKPDASPPVSVVTQQPINIRNVSPQAQEQSDWYAPEGWTAIFTGLLFVATFGLWIFTGLMWKATRDVALLSVKRPWLFISGPFRLFEDNYQGDFWCYVKYFVANHGEAPAIIEDVQCDFIREISEPALSVIRSNDLIVNPIIGPAETRNDISTTVPDRILGNDTLTYDEDGSLIHLPKQDGQRLMLRIKIQYRGISSKGHESAALWQWNFTLCQFEVFGGEKENYAR